MTDFKCQICKQVINENDSFCKWYGPPFSMRAEKEICCYCLGAMKPKIVKKNEDDPGIAIIGTYNGDVYTLSEMIAEGFDKKRASLSIRIVGKCLALSQSEITKRLRT